MTTIETDRLTIRNFSADDWQDLHEMILQYQSSGYAQYDHPWPTSAQEIKGIAQWFASGDSFLAVCLKTTRKLIGFIALNREERQDCAEYNLGYVFNADYHGQGYATESCRAILEHAFGALAADRVISGTAVANQASCRLLKRLGMQVTSQSSGSFQTTPDGKSIEFLGMTFAITKDEWSAARPKVRLALLGCGGMMGAHAQRLKNHPDVEIVGLCDVSEDLVTSFAAKHLAGTEQRPRYFNDPATMYEALTPDAVLISTPHTQHYSQGVQALAAGCHVFMEKPMVTSLEDAYALADAVKKSGKIFVIGYNTPCSGEFFHLRELIRTKTLGKLELVTGFISQDWLRATAGLWRQEPSLSGGGQAYDSGAHLFNSLCWSVESDVEEVFAYVDNHGAKVDINSVSSIKFTNGVLANITIGGNCPGGGSFMAFIFDGGRVEIDGWGAGWINIWKGDQKVKYPAITPEMGAPSPDHNFIDAILGRAEPRTSVYNGIIQSQLMDAIYESERTGKPARPKRER